MNLQQPHEHGHLQQLFRWFFFLIHFIVLPMLRQLLLVQFRCREQQLHELGHLQERIEVVLEGGESVTVAPDFRVGAVCQRAGENLVDIDFANPAHK